MINPPRYPTVDPAAFDTAQVHDMALINAFAHGVTNTADDAEKITRPWFDADARATRRRARREEATAA